MIRWSNESDGVDIVNELVNLFIEHTGVEYITHIEIDEGRALNEREWSPNLKDILYTQFYHSVKQGNILMAIENEKIVGFANVYIKDYITTIDDIVSIRKGIGTALMNEIEKIEGTFMADVSPNNIRAKAFMEKLGYKVSTLVYRKN